MRFTDSLDTYAMIVNIIALDDIKSTIVFDHIKAKTDFSDAKIFRQIKKLVGVGVLTKTKFRDGILSINAEFKTMLWEYDEMTTQALIVEHLVKGKKLGVLF